MFSGLKSQLYLSLNPFPRQIRFALWFETKNNVDPKQTIFKNMLLAQWIRFVILQQLRGLIKYFPNFFIFLVLHAFYSISTPMLLYLIIRETRYSNAHWDEAPKQTNKY